MDKIAELLDEDFDEPANRFWYWGEGDWRNGIVDPNESHPDA